MMFSHRLTRIAAVTAALAATAAPAAYGLPQDMRSPDARDAAQHRGIYEPARSEGQPKPQDLRNPDTIDYADGRGTYNAPDVVVVEAPAPAPESTVTGIDWEDVGIGAGGLLGASLLALGGALLFVQRRGARARTAH
jgi:hypothetical protein